MEVSSKPKKKCVWSTNLTWTIQRRKRKERRVESKGVGGKCILKKERRNLCSYGTLTIATSKISTHWWTSQYFTNKGNHWLNIKKWKMKQKKGRKKSYLLVVNALMWAAKSGGGWHEGTKPIEEDGEAGGSNDCRMGAYGQQGYKESEKEAEVYGVNFWARFISYWVVWPNLFCLSINKMAMGPTKNWLKKFASIWLEVLIIAIILLFLRYLNCKLFDLSRTDLNYWFIFLLSKLLKRNI